MIIKLTSIQKERVSRLEGALQLAASKGDLELAKIIIRDLEHIFNSTGNQARLLQARIRLYEASMEAGNVATAESGLINIRSKANKHTRTFLEASSILAICYLRMKNLKKAEPIIREVLTNDSVIKSHSKRIDFRKNIIDRFDEEGLLFAMRDEGSTMVKHNYIEIENEAGNLIRHNANEDDLFETIGSNVPSSAKNVLKQVDDFSKRQLPSAERLALPSGTEVMENKKVGKTLFSSLKRVLYNSICDKDDDVYKEYTTKGVSGFTAAVTVIVVDTLNKLNISIRVMIAAIIAVVIKMGLALYCEHYRPSDIMELR
jgi:hypothetical protein